MGTHAVVVLVSFARRMRLRPIRQLDSMAYSNRLEGGGAVGSAY